VNKPGKLFLLPVPVSEENGLIHIPQYNIEIIQKLEYFIAEDAKIARRFLKSCGYPVEKANISLLNEHHKNEDVSSLLELLLKGHDAGLMSDAGCPGIADPGAELIKLAHRKNIEVAPLVGPSSIVLSIMASGFNGQNFAFNGYLPVDKHERTKKIKELEQISKQRKQAQFFIETPYRNAQMLESLLGALQPETYVFIGKALLSASQFVKSARVSDLKKSQLPDLNKIPVVFGIYTH
jgi:16S rRNA (cytidine1402-2'-O)-methyltransferase